MQLPTVISLVIIATRVCSTLQTEGKSKAATFLCPGPYNCSCNRSPTGDYELQCPRNGEISLSISIQPEERVWLQCSTNHWSDFSLIKDFNVGKVKNVQFRLCPLPNQPLAEVIQAMGAVDPTTLVFRSLRNLSNTLERKHLSGLGGISRLLLSENDLTDLPEDLLEDMRSLTWLDLRDNQVHLPPKFFQHTPNLTVLELGNNHIRELPTDIFRNLTKLRLLNLWRNNLQDLNKELFGDLKKLEALDLNSNGITSLPADVFDHLAELKNLSLYGNNFSVLPEGLFKSTTALERVRLFDNRRPLNLPDGLFGNLTQLKEVYLDRCNVGLLPENLLEGTASLTNFSLQRNNISEIPEALFRDTRDLLYLDLSYNHLRAIPPTTFNGLRKLSVLLLGYNHLTEVSQNMFLGLRGLQSLDLQHNAIRSIDQAAFLDTQRLRQVRLSHNNISFGSPIYDPFGPYSPLQHLVGLENLWLANNSIDEIYSDWRITMNRLRTLDLSFNKIRAITIHDLHFLSSDLSVDLRHNNISSINLKGAEFFTSQQPPDNSKQVRVYVEDNPLDCDCYTYAFWRYLNDEMTPRVKHFVNIIPGNLTCAKPRKLRNKPVIIVDSEEFTCPVDSHCPAGCSCFFRAEDLALLVDCQEAHISKIPQELPTLTGANHTELYLQSNFISALPGQLPQSYENVTHLIMSNNNLSTISITSLPPHLKVLDVSYNNISRLDNELIEYLMNSTQPPKSLKVVLHGNPWSCNCQALPFLNFIQARFKHIPYLPNVTCKGSEKKLTGLTASDLCPVSTAVIVTVCVIVAVFGVVLGILAALYYRYQREVKVWLYARRLCLWFVTEEELDKDKLYDAFVSYSHKDEEFVVNKLVPGLERGEIPFKLCLHYRDWIAGEWIPNQIARSVDDSRRTVVVLSPNFLESVWGRMEFRTAHCQALAEKRTRVIVILYGDVGPTDKLDPELRAYLTMNTYVKWGDPWFWDKLRYALPHPPELAKHGKRRCGPLEDKLELIRADVPPLAANGQAPIQT